MMFNNSLFNEEAKLKIAEREREVEIHRLHTQLGYRERGSLRWIFGFMTLIVALILILALL
jgi:hypothetical protein